MVENSKATGGGAATNAGIDYQSSVAAWYMCKLIAESGTSPIYDLASGDKLTQIDFETDEPTDDINLKTHLGHSIYVQAKRSLSLGESEDSELAKSIAQFVKQYLKSKGSGGLGKERYVLAFSGKSPRTLDKAAEALNKLRGGTPPDRLPADEKKELDKVKAHVKRLISEEDGNEPTDETITELLSYLYLHKLDVLDSESDAQAAQDILRGILADRSQALLAWNTLRSDAVSFGRQRGSVKIEGLAEKLGDKGVVLVSAVDYTADIAKLKDYTQKVTLPILERSSSVTVEGVNIKLDRKPVQDMVSLVSQGKSFLVIGEPGAGKSGALYELVNQLHTDGIDTLAIATEQISSSSFGDLQKELNLDNPLNNVLMNWRGDPKGVVVIDALDAARDPNALKLFMDVADTIMRANDRWSVVISIRKYDLRHNNKLERMFPREQLSEFIDPEFSTAHINIPLLSDEERKQLVGQSSKLDTLVQKAGPRMLELLRSPFNIKIAAEIMDNGVDPDDLTQIDTQIGLLDRYWDERVADGGGDGTTRNVLVKSIATSMVSSQSLKVAKASIAEQNPTSHDQLETLLSRGVLSEESQGDFLSFSHHILYDYAVYRTVLRTSSDGIKDLLSTNAYLALSIRPSIQMYWQYKWHSDSSRKSFWSEIIKIEQDDSISRLAKSLGIQVAIESIKNPEDIKPLIDLMKDTNQPTENAALSVYKRCSDIMTATKRRGEPDNAEKWISAIDEILTLKDDYPTRVASCSILESAVEKWSEVSPKSKIVAGSAARKLLEVEIEKQPPNRWLMRLAIKLTAGTFETNPSENGRVLNMLLDEKLVQAYGYLYLGDLADCVGLLTNQDNDLVYRIYETAFGYNEKSEDVTSMGSSQILGLNSSKRQDYDMVYWHLGQKYKEVANTNLTIGLKALDRVLVETANRHGINEKKKIVIKTFPYYESEQSIERTRAYSWHMEPSTGDKGHETYEAFNQYAEELSKDPEGPEKLRNAIEQNAGITNSTQFWVLILTIGARYPKTLGSVLIPLLTAEPFLQSPMTSEKLGEFIVAMYPALDVSTRQKIEKLLTTAPQRFEDEYDKNRALWVRDTVFAEVDEGQLVTEQALELRTAQMEKKETGQKEPDQTGWIEGDSDNFWERGKPEEDKKLLRLSRDKQMSIYNLQPSDISLEKIAGLFTLIDEFEAALTENAPAEESSKYEIRRLIAKVYENICRSPVFNPNSEEWGGVIEKVLEIITVQQEGSKSEESEDNEEESVVSDYGPRSIAVETLMVITNKETDSARLAKFRDFVRELASDQSPSARFQVANHIHYLWRKDDSDFMWEIVNKIKDEETNSEIVHSLVISLSHLRNVDPKQTYSTLISIYKKWQTSKNEKLRENAIQQIIESYVRHDDPDAKTLLDEILARPIGDSPELERVEVHLRSYLVYGIEDPEDEESTQIRARTRAVLLGILGSYDEDKEYQKWAKKHEGKNQNDLTKEDIQEIRTIMGHTENIANQIYFASGSYDEKTNKSEGLSDDAKKLFIQEQQELIDKIADTGRVKAAHELVEMALAYQDTDPVWTLQLVEKLITNSASQGSTSESLMTSSITTYIKRFIASHREHLKEVSNQQSLINILDGFVETGWPEAINLMDDLEEIFR